MSLKFLIFSLPLSILLFADTQEEQSIEALATQYIGGKYIWGGETPQGFDCSGYTQYIYKQVGINLPRTALQQSKVGKTIIHENYKKGDLLFFLTDKRRGIPITHVGIYLEENKFIHAASTKKGIIISDLTTSHYGKLLVTASRVLTEEQQQEFTPKLFNRLFIQAVKSNTKISTVPSYQEQNLSLSLLERAIRSDTKIYLNKKDKVHQENNQSLSWVQKAIQSDTKIILP